MISIGNIYIKLTFSFILCLFIGQQPIHEQKIIDLRDYGVVPNSHQNAVRGIQKALKDASKYESSIIRFPRGRIDLWPEGAKKKTYYISNATESDTLSKVKTIGILLQNMENVTLDGNGTIIMSHGKMVHLVLDHCKNIKVKDIGFDFERPTMSEFKIEKLGENFAIVRVHKDTRYNVNNGNVIWYGAGWKTNNLHVIRYDPSEEMMYYFKSDFIETSHATALEGNKILFRGDTINDFDLEEGDVLTFRAPYRDGVGILNHFSENLTFTNVGLHYMHGLGILSQFCRNISMDNIEATPRENTGRVIAGFADFLHFSGCSGEIKIENSLFSGSHDDPVHIHGTHLRVVDHDQNKVRVKFMHHQTWNLLAFEPGDSIAFVDNRTLLAYDHAVVEQVTKINPRELELVLNKSVPADLEEKHGVENITKTPSVVIRNNRFEHTTTRGLLVTTRRKVLIENNTFYRTGMHAILIANDLNFWYESGPVRDVTIRENKFIQCGYNSFPDTYPIAIEPVVLDFVEDKYVHSNIRIEDNIFVLLDNALLKAVATEGLIFKGNTLRKGEQGLSPESDSPMFSFEHCDQVNIESNAFNGFIEEKTIRIEEMGRDNLTIGKNQEFILERKQ